MPAIPRWTFMLAALGVGGPALAQPTLANIGPVAVDFGAIKMGDTVSVPVTVQNISPGNVSIASSGINGVAQFSIDGSNCNSKGYVIGAGDSCFFTVSFTPTDAGGTTFTTATAILVQTSTITQIAQMNFSGSGTEALVEVTPVSIDFGDTFIGQQRAVPVTITNTHKAPIFFSGGGVGNGPFYSGADCGSSGASLARCHFYYTFTPSATGPVQTTASIGVSSTSPTSMSQYFPIALKGNGVATLPTPNVAVWPVAIDFGQIKVGHAASVLFYAKNNSPGDITQAGGGFNDDQGGVFEAFTTGGTGCNSQSQAAGVTCSNTYQFDPHAIQTYSATTGVDFSNFAATYFVSYAFTGTGVGTLARVTPTTIDLGTVAFGTSTSVPVVITNTSDAPLSNFTGGADELTIRHPQQLSRLARHWPELCLHLCVYAAVAAEFAQGDLHRDRFAHVQQCRQQPEWHPADCADPDHRACGGPDLR